MPLFLQACYGSNLTPNILLEEAHAGSIHPNVGISLRHFGKKEMK